MAPNTATKLVVILVVLAFLVALVAPGRAVAQSAPQRIVTIRDAETENLVRRLSHPLFRTAGVDPGLVRITLIQNRAINAFVSTGNRLFIHTGLIQQSGTVRELVGVLAHETGHIAGGHLARLPEEMRAAMLRSVAAMLLGGVAAAASGQSGALAAGMLGGQASAMGEFYAFTRSQEQSADQAAVTYLDRLGWSSRGMEALLEKLLDQELLVVGRQDPYFRTHPLSRDRLEFAREHIARSRFADAPMPPGFDSAFAMVRAKLDGFIDAPASTWRRYPPSDTSAPARYARTIAQFRSGRIPLAVQMIDGLLAEDPNSPWLNELKGQILFEGHRPAEALAPYARASRLAPDEPLIRLSYARVLIELGQPAQLRQAVAELEATLARERESPFVWRQMAIAQGRLGNLPQADLALAEEALLLGNARTARLLARRAEEALPAGPQRLRAQDLRNAAAPENLPSR
ncbi:M48 family metalloprotease [Falsiroseomonas selenitidurans]|uniref:M48 family metalloprotease n=1 Tax=Falsiroseomonas selenitidurans TaxID=2716335 RepID=A0ABX1E708_9PROT|nr:M48 family metalloprotease [Falsiroseomonas selenitidurans]NKC32999.1 M48 family metalloprotease [Falsiroseomonas selenitidurans]